MFKYLKPESLKDFFRVRDENNELDYDQVIATCIQTGLFLITFTTVILLLYYTGVI